MLFFLIRNNKKMEETLEALCRWLRETKCITKIDIFELVGYLPEYEDYLREECVEISKSYYKSKDGAIKKGLFTDDKYYAPRNDC